MEGKQGIMDNIQKVVLNIVKASLKNEKLELSQEVDLNEVFRIAKKHQITVMMYYGLINCGVDQSNPVMQQLFMFTCQNVATSEQQMYALGQIFSEFDKSLKLYSLKLLIEPH